MPDVTTPLRLISGTLAHSEVDRWLFLVGGILIGLLGFSFSGHVVVLVLDGQNFLPI
jgi:hypothetical protein